MTQYLRLVCALAFMASLLIPPTMVTASESPPARPLPALAQATAIILITNDGLSPAAVTVPPGVVRWQNTTTATVTLVSSGGNRVFVPVAPNATGAPAIATRQAASSGFSVPIPPGGTAELTFTDPGTHTYTVTNLNGGSSTGTITVATGLTPTATTDAASSVGATSATVGGSVDPKGQPSTVAFQYGTTAGGPYPRSVPATPLTPTTAISVTGVLTPLLPDTRYYYQTVITTTGGTASGNEQSVLTLPAPPVLNVTPISPTNQLVPTITGTVSANVTAVSIYTNTTCTGTPITQTTPLSGTFIVTATVPANTLVSFAATATNASGVSACSAQSIDYYADTIPPSVPEMRFLSTAGVSSTTQLRALWFASTDDRTTTPNLRYQLCLNTSETGCFTNGTIFTYTGELTDFTNQMYVTATNLLPGTWYYGRVRAIDEAGNSSGESAQAVASTLNNSVKQIAAGTNFSCALLGTGNLACWGRNDYGQSKGSPDYPIAPSLNPIDPHPQPALLNLSGNNLAIQVDAGLLHTCVVHADGAAACWGGNAAGQLGGGGPTTEYGSRTVGGATPLTGIVQIAAGYLNSCAAIADGTARCWGNGSSVPATVTIDGTTPLTGVLQVAVGRYHSCALLADSTVRCWGSNTSGQLGAGASDSLSHPFPEVVGGATPLIGVTRIAAGYDSSSTCALLADGTARCWGSNSDGQLGDGTSGGNSATPVVVGGATPLGGIIAIDAGAKHACALLRDGTARCWGLNNLGQLGGGSLTTPVGGATTPLRLIVQIAAGSQHTCALISDGTVKCWGTNTYGELGTARFLRSWTSDPQQVQGLLQ